MASESFIHYLKNIQKAIKRGDATEHTHRRFLQDLVESLIPGITATNEPKRVDCGAPDIIVSRRSIPLGYIETKAVGVPLDKIEKSDQFKRYIEGLSNFILTDYLEFRWFVEREERMTCRIATRDRDGKLNPDQNGIDQLQLLLLEFLNQTPTIIKSPKRLAGRMAALAKIIRNAILDALNRKGNGGKLEDLLDGFKKVLIHNLTKEQFADMYSQTICYGLFAAACNYEGPAGEFNREHAGYDLPKTNPFLRNVFNQIAGPDLDDRITWAVDDLAEILNRADFDSILRDFGKRTKQQDPVLHFYETFLAAYDPKMREARGVYYTPEPVVSYIVRSVDHILKNDFGLPDGLADTSKVSVPRIVYDEKKSGKTHEVMDEFHKVLVLDPAVGTGTFLHGVIDHIYDHLIGRGQKGAWSKYVSEHLLPRLFGFELLMAPYTIAHMKLGIQLKDLSYDFKGKERLGIYLTNTLEEADEVTEKLTFARELVKEANAAVKVKLELPILVVLGNPPYSGHSANTGKWIEDLLRGKDRRTDTKTENYFEVDGEKLKERNPKWLNDDYVKFIRFAQWRIENTGHGILAFISNHGYIDNPTFRGMRQSLMATFDDIYILDLHGNSKKKEKCPDGSKDENVFDIQQGVAIGIFVKRKGAKKKAASVHHANLWGVRNNKYHHLFETDVSTTEWEQLEPQSPFYLFISQDTELLAEYEEWWKVTQIMPVNVLGFQTHRDHFAFDFDRYQIQRRIHEMRDDTISDQDYYEKYVIKDNRDWHLAEARQILRNTQNWETSIIQCLYRPFDRRYCYFSEIAMDYPRRELLDHVASRSNLCLNTVRQTRLEAWQHALVSDSPAPAVYVELKDGSTLFPLYLYPSKTKTNLFDDTTPSDAPGGRRPNLAPEFIKDFASRLKLKFIPDGKGDLKKTFGPEDIFDYIYAVFHSPTYRTRYAEFLKIDFPRLPLTSSKKLFRALCAPGSELVGLHLMEKHGPSITGYPVEGDDIVEKVRYTEPGQGSDKGRVWINKTQYFDGISVNVWEFQIGGYQVCRKWLKDRKGRQLSYDDISHYQQVVSALSETIGLMSKVDEIIDANGGWPIS